MHFVQPHDAPGAPNRPPVYQRSRDSYLAARNILISLQQSGQLPAAGNSDLITLANYLADINERPREGREPRAVSSK